MASPAAASAEVLQQQYDELHSLMPVLPLSCAPKALSDLLSQGAGKAVGSASSRCQICSRQASSLGLLCTTHCIFAARRVQTTAVHFACSVCRAVSSPELLLQLAMPVPSSDTSRADALHLLFLHFAAVNGAPARITANPEALAVWMQELACRASGLRVMASSLSGWELLGPTGQQVQPAGVSRLLRQLVQQQQQQPLGVAAAAVGKQAAAPTVGDKQPLKKKKKKLEPQQAQQPEPAPGLVAPGQQGSVTAKKSKKRHSVEATAAAVATSGPAVTSSSSKKVKQQTRRDAAAAAPSHSRHQLNTPQTAAKKKTKLKRRLSDPS